MIAIAGTTKLLGVIGHPVEHSLSPIMHNAAIAHMGMDYVYLPLPVQPENLATALTGFAAINLQGFSITIPHKQAIMPLLAEISPVAQAVGAVNTVWRTDQGWSGTNTDVAGFLAPLQAREQDWRQARVAILGNGGAARAVVVGCEQLGCAEICIVGRNWEKLQTFQHSWADSAVASKLSLHRWETLPNLLPTVNLLVNATPIGMYPNGDDSPLTLEAQNALSSLPAGAIAYDLIYTPNPTQFLRQAAAVGAIAIDGLEMLVQQGAAALQLWLQHPPPADVMRQALKRSLGI